MAPNNQEDEDYAEFKLPEDTLFVFKNYSPQKIEQRSEIKAKLHMPIWNLKEDIVVSGMSGRFPGLCTQYTFEPVCQTNHFVQQKVTLLRSFITIFLITLI